MVMSYIWTVFVGISILSALLLGNGSDVAAAVASGAQSGITLSISLAGSICLWCGVGNLMEHAGITDFLSRLIQPLLRWFFPSSRNDRILAGSLSANICANFLGLGNAATPMGIQAAQRLAAKKKSGIASDELCRLVVLNTASIQLIPANVAAIRTSLGCVTPFDILPAVWITSVCSAALGLLAAMLFGRLSHHG